MAKSSSKNEVFDNFLCSKDCKKNTETLNKKITDLSNKLFDANNMIYHYKLALAQVESRLIEYKEREVKYCEKIKTLEFYNESNNECIEILKKKLETLKEENKGVDGKLAGLLKASKDLDNLIESQRSDKNKDGLGYSVVPPLPAQLYLSPNKDLSWTGLPKCADDTVTDYSRPSPIVESTSGEDQNKNSSASENGESTDSILSKPAVKFVNASERKREKKGTSRSQNKTHESFTPRPAAYRPFRPPVRPMRSNMNSAQPNKTTFNKQAHSYANKPFQRISAVRSQYKALWVPTVNRNFPHVNRKFPTGNSNVSTVCCCCSRHVNTARLNAVINRRNWVNDVKASARWVWKPIKSISASIILKRYDYVDVRGISRSVMAWVPKKD
uniref:Uncharacterized protein n=1 Tax=Tanacetum cinerariifolium TaxID=118510 RepID=A0A6L2MEG2_TANCI|nr:hypothetical protein [Tanacetum cinerariifolium]